MKLQNYHLAQLAEEHFDYAVSMRRQIHENPELSDHEDETVVLILKELAEMGIPSTEIPRGGVLGFIEGTKPGKTVLLRADIDALPICETERNLKQKRTCRSKNEGIMHACGHDAHTAMLLTAGRMLQSLKSSFEGTVILCFERGEEGTGNVRTITRFMKEHEIHFDSCFAMHVETTLETGMLAVSPGMACAGTIPLHFRITGRGGHGSRPDLCINPIDCAVGLMQAVNSLRMKYITPFELLTVAFCQVVGGTAGNVIPDTVELQGTARFFNTEKTKIPFKRELERLLQTVGETYQCQIENLKPDAGAFPLNNDEHCSVLAKEAMQEIYGEDSWCPQCVTMGAESFPYFLMEAPGCYCNLGIRNEEKGSGAVIHNSSFDIDEDSLKVGAAMHVGFALKFLGES